MPRFRKRSSIYVRDQCAVSFRTREAFGGLSNMAGGYPIQIRRTTIRTSEALYQCMKFPRRPSLQCQILAESSPIVAKNRTKPYRPYWREDWDEVRVDVMCWVLRVKLACNWDRFVEELLATGDLQIVEESRKDRLWGAVADRGGQVLQGANVLGQMLTHLRERVKRGAAERLMCVDPPDVGDFRLLGKAVPRICPGATTLLQGPELKTGRVTVNQRGGLKKKGK